MSLSESRARRLFACMGDPSRFRVVTRLLESERCVTELAAAVGLSQSCTTRHLQALEREGLVTGERRGRKVIFRVRVEDAWVGGLVAWAAAHPGAADAADPASIRPRAERTARAAEKAAVAEPRDAPAGSLGEPVLPAPGGDDTEPPVTAASRRRRSGADLEDFLL